MLELNKFTLKCFLIVFIFIQVDNSFGQKVVYQTLSVYKKTRFVSSFNKNPLYEHNGRNVTTWYFKEGHWPEVMVDGDGKILEPQ